MKKQNLENKARLCPYVEDCVMDNCEKEMLDCLGEANHYQCVVYRHFSKTDPKYLKK